MILIIFGPGGINKKHWYQSPEFVIDRVGNYREKYILMLYRNIR